MIVPEFKLSEDGECAVRNIRGAVPPDDVYILLVYLVDHAAQLYSEMCELDEELFIKLIDGDPALVMYMETVADLAEKIDE